MSEPVVTVRSAAASVGHVDSPEENVSIRAVVRVRPFQPREIAKLSLANEPVRTCVRAVGNTVVLERERAVAMHKKSSTDDAFAFDAVIWSIPPEQLDPYIYGTYLPPAQGQEDVFLQCGDAAIKSCMEGYNYCIFAYGQTSSGKSHTVIGPESDPGVAPRFAASLFEEIERRKAKDDRLHFSVELCCFEIYNERATDLLVSSISRRSSAIGDSSSAGSVGDEDMDVGIDESPSLPFEPEGALASACSPTAKSDSPSVGDLSIATTTSLEAKTPKINRNFRIRFHPELGAYIPGLRREILDDEHSLRVCMRKALNARTTASTNMNDQSSRSHAIIQLTVTQENHLMGFKKVAIVSIVDLAGSERIKMSLVTGANLTEAKNINLSLTTLRRVIDILIDNAAKKKQSVPPYRESMLTWLLCDSLGGNSKTTMIATISPNPEHAEDTLSTLRYANKAKSITCRVRVNERSVAVTVSEVQHEVTSLKKRLESNVSNFEEAQKALDKQLTKQDNANRVARKQKHIRSSRHEAIHQTIVQTDAKLETLSIELAERCATARHNQWCAEETARLQHETDQLLQRLSDEKQAFERAVEEKHKAERCITHYQQALSLRIPHVAPIVEEHRRVVHTLWRRAFVGAAKEKLLHIEVEELQELNRFLREKIEKQELELEATDSIFNDIIPLNDEIARKEEKCEQTAKQIAAVCDKHATAAASAIKTTATLKEKRRVAQQEAETCNREIEEVRQARSTFKAFCAHLTDSLQAEIGSLQNDQQRIEDEIRDELERKAQREESHANNKEESANSAAEEEWKEFESERSFQTALWERAQQAKQTIAALQDESQRISTKTKSVELENDEASRKLSCVQAEASDLIKMVKNAEHIVRHKFLPDADEKFDDSSAVSVLRELQRVNEELVKSKIRGRSPSPSHSKSPVR